MLFINLREAYKVPVGYRTSSLNLVSDVNFMLVLLESRCFYEHIRTVHLTTSELSIR